MRNRRATRDRTLSSNFIVDVGDFAAFLFTIAPRATVFGCVVAGVAYDFAYRTNGAVPERAAVPRQASKAPAPVGAGHLATDSVPRQGNAEVPRAVAQPGCTIVTGPRRPWRMAVVPETSCGGAPGPPAGSMTTVSFTNLGPWQ